MDALQAIVSDDEIAKEHWGNFGPDISPREVVNLGVASYGWGHTTGHTMMQILLAHKLVKKPRPGKYKSKLTERGKLYFAALPKDHPHD